MGAEHHQAIVSLVERSTRYTILIKISSKHAAIVTKAITKKLRKFSAFSHTLTFDNGKEFFGPQQMEKSLNIMVYFAEPYASSQRRSNENTNGLVRQAFPQRKSFDTITQTETTQRAHAMPESSTALSQQGSLLRFLQELMHSGNKYIPLKKIIPMRYLAALISLAASPPAKLACAQIPVTAPEPQRAVNFSRKPNACYIASALQALIAIPAWRSYIMNYPCTNKQDYDAKMLEGLQNLIRNYTNAANNYLQQPVHMSPAYDMGNFDAMLCKNRKLVKFEQSTQERSFGNPDEFINNLGEALSNTRECSFFSLFKFDQTFTTIYPSDKSLNNESNLILKVSSSPIEQELKALLKQQYLQDIHHKDYGPLKREMHFTSLPSILRIQIDLPKERFEQLQLFYTAIPTVLNLQEFIKPELRTALGPTDYELISIIWQSHNHIIAYVKYDTWYVCDDLYPSCEVAKNYLQDFKVGHLLNFHGYKIFYPSLLLYQRVQEKTPNTQARLQELNASLQLLSI